MRRQILLTLLGARLLVGGEVPPPDELPAFIPPPVATATAPPTTKPIRNEPARPLRPADPGPRTSEPVPPKPPPTPPGAWHYEVKPGEVLSTIAERELGKSTRWIDIARLNCMVEPFTIRTGQILVMPPRPKTGFFGLTHSRSYPDDSETERIDPARRIVSGLLSRGWLLLLASLLAVAGSLIAATRLAFWLLDLPPDSAARPAWPACLRLGGLWAGLSCVCLLVTIGLGLFVPVLMVLGPPAALATCGLATRWLRGLTWKLSAVLPALAWLTILIGLYLPLALAWILG